jgi:hypothetical protein
MISLTAEAIVIARTGPYVLVKRNIAHGYIVRTPLVSYHVRYDGARLYGSADVQRLRSELPHIAKWAVIQLNAYATSTAHTSKDQVNAHIAA